MGIFENLRDRAKKRAMYDRTVYELRRTSLDTQLDIGIYAGDIEEVARKAVYGR